jgi:hypothetical protein
LRQSGTENAEEHESIRTQIPQVGEQIFKLKDTLTSFYSCRVVVAVAEAGLKMVCKEGNQIGILLSGACILIFIGVFHDWESSKTS